MAPSCSAARGTAGTAAARRRAPRGRDEVDRARAAGRELGDRALRDDAALVDDRRDVAGLLDLVEQVRGQPDGAALVDERADQSAELEDAGRVEAVDRLVEDEQLGVAQQAAGDAEALAHAERVRADLVVAAAAEADAVERAVDPPVGGLVARRGVHVEVLAAGEVAVEARLLDDRADARQRRRAAAGEVVAEQAHLPARRPGEAEQQADQRRLAGPVRPQEAERAAARHLQVDGLERGAVTEALAQAVGLDGELGHGPILPAPRRRRLRPRDR